MTTRAIVIGASMAGLAAARVLSDHVEVVDVVERDQLADLVGPRRGVPQGRHAHAILTAGERLIADWFPGIVDQLTERGAARVDGTGGWWYQSGGFKVRADWGVAVLCLSRPLLENTVRERLAQLPNVAIHDNVSVDNLLIEGDRVSGIVVDGVEWRADLVVDCSGRHTRFLDQLADVGFPTPAVSSVQVDVAYGTRLLRRRSDDFDGSFALVAPTPPEQFRAAVLLPIEDDRWILTLAGMHGDAPPTDDDGYVAFARSLPTSLIAELLERAEPLSPVMSHRLPSSQRRHFERLVRTPRGFVALGDAICSFNPIYGQGMSSAALQAEALGRTIERHGLTSAALARRFYRRAAKVVTNPWTIAAGADFTHPATTGPKPAGTDVVNRYIDKVMKASHTSARVQSQLTRVQNLVASPQSLMAPAMVARVLFAARRSPVRTGVAGPAPVMGTALAPASSPS